MVVDAALDIFPQIQSLVSDKLQVVSYKWLSRNFSISSNYAKRLLQEFAEKYNNELEVTYTLAGWLKSDPQVYRVKLTSSHKLSEAKKEFQDGCSVQIYSIQACIPNDLAVLWNTEFVQAEELFNQPPMEDNCLRDNRFCAVSNSFVKRIIYGKHAIATLTKPTNYTRVSVASKYKDTEDLKPVQTAYQGLAGPSIAKIGMQTSDAVTILKSDKTTPEDVGKATKPPDCKEDAAAGNTKKSKVPNEKPSSGNTGSLSSFWNRASGKPKPLPSATESTNEVPVAAVEAMDASAFEDDDHDVSYKREPNGQSARKRKVVFDFSDEEDEENLVSLASPDLPLGKCTKDSTTHTSRSSLMEGNHSNSEAQKVDKLNNVQDDFEHKNTLLLSKEDSSSGTKKMFTGASLSKKTGSHDIEVVDKGTNGQCANSGSSSPKRKKVLKTRIDDRGREVNEVVWEGETADSDKTEKNITTNDAANRPPMVNKAQSPISGVLANQASKAGNKKQAKGGPKDPKQGNILSFFKRV